MRRAERIGYSGEHFTDEEFLALVEISGGRCLRCGSREELSADHVIPLSLGGTNTKENIQVLCCACNGEKGSAIADYRERGPPASLDSLRIHRREQHS